MSDISPEMQALLDEIANDPTLEASEEEKAATAVASSNVPAISQQIDNSPVPVAIKSAKAGKYITFTLANEDYGLYILSVKEIIGMMRVTKVPKTPDFVRGVINLRGKIHPVIDLRKRFNLEMKEDDERTPIIIVEVRQGSSVQFIGIVVDTVSEVINVEKGDIEKTPAFGKMMDTSFILGLAKINNRVVTLLDIDQILSNEHLVLVSELAQ
jgi:purine-binding chemotaxis protein CheW